MWFSINENIARERILTSLLVVVHNGAESPSLCTSRKRGPVLVLSQACGSPRKNHKIILERILL